MTMQLEASKSTATQPRSYEKNYREMLLGGGHVNRDMQQFMENDRKVLRYFAVMDDLLTAQYERRPFILFYFLADDTMEIREQYPLNCGEDNYWKVEDLYVGLQGKFLGYTFCIYDADEHTK